MRGVLRLSVFVCLAAGGAAAQDLPYSDAATADCIAAAPGTMEKRACIGASADACMAAAPDGGTTVSMGGCLDRELSFWDGVLNANYQSARARARETDAEMQRIGASVQGLEAALRDMQRAWIAYRDATCEFERAQWGGGTGGGPAVVDCLMRMTGVQALYLGDASLGN